MKILRHSPEWMRAVAKASDGKTTNWLSVVVLYDDAQLAHAASRKCREIEKNVDHAKIYAIRTINLNTLPGSEGSQMASAEAATADLVFVCLKTDHELSRWTQLWMREWASKRQQNAGALIHFCHQEHCDDWRTTLVREFLGTVASLGHMELVEAGTEQNTPTYSGLN
tara:strand:- start:5523 stop:6026 length:504 start_codon:yes stop_codon:yes gene_type:complete